MEQKKHSQKFLRQRKFLTVLPVLIIPFLTLMFWALGGGKGQASTLKQGNHLGLDLQLPEANLKTDKPLNKLSYYELADKDSAKLKDMIRSDPYFNEKFTLDTARTGNGFTKDISFGMGNYGGAPDASLSLPGNGIDSNEAKVYSKLKELNKALDQDSKGSQSKAMEHIDNHPYSSVSTINSPDMDNLGKMMAAMNADNGPDTELLQLDNMMDKILDIQHPERVNERMKLHSGKNRRQVYPVYADNNETSISLLQPRSHNSGNPDTSGRYNDKAQNGFYSLNDHPEINGKENAIEAVMHETQTLVNGSTVKLRLLTDVYIDGILIPNGSFIYGTASLNGERLNVNISTVRYQQNILPVSLSVYDLDGIAGIYIPGAITRDAAKQSADQSIQNFGLSTLDPTLGAQAASAGIAAAKNLLSKKVKLIKVTVKAGYMVLLRDNNQKDTSN